MAARYWVGGSATWDNTAGTKWALTSGGAGGQAVPTSADTVFFDAASGAGTVTLGITGVCSTITMTGFTGTLAFGTNKIQLAGSTGATVYTGATTFTVSGTPLMELTYAGSPGGTRTIAAGSVTEGRAISFSVTGSSDIIAVTGNVKSLNFTGFSGTWNPGSTPIIYGSITLSSTMTLGTTNPWLLQSTSITQVITANGKTIPGITQNGVGGTVQFSSGTTTMVAGSTYTLTSGTLDIGTNTATLSVPSFVANTGGSRSIIFGTGNITCTGTGTVWNTGTGASLTYTGTPTVNISNNSATATTVTASTTNGASTNAFNFNFTTGTYALTLTTGSVVRNLNFTGFTGTWSPGTANATIYGNVTLVSGMTFNAGTGTWTFAATSGTQTITSGGKTLCNITQNGSGGTLLLPSGTTTVGAVTLTAGTLDVGTNTSTLSCSSFSSSGSTARSIIFGTGNITCTGSGTVWNTGIATSLTYTGTPTVNISNNTPTATTVTAGTVSGLPANAFNFNFTIGTYALTLTTGSVVRNLNFTGFTGSWAPGTATATIYGNVTLVSGMTFTTGTGIWGFGNGTTQIITCGGKTVGPINLANTSTVLQLADTFSQTTTAAFVVGTGTSVNINAKTNTFGTISYDFSTPFWTGGTIVVSGITQTGGTASFPVANLTLNGAYTFTAGTLDLTSGSLTCTTFSSSNTNVRAIAFGSNAIIITSGVSSPFSMTGTNFTYTGTPTVQFTYSSTGTLTVTTTTFSESNALDFYFTSGTYTLDGPTIARNLIYTGFSGSSSLASKTIYGNLTLSAGITLAAGANQWSFSGTTGTQVITTNGKTIDFPLVFNGTGTYQLADNLAVGTATTRAFTLTSGTLDLNNKTVTLFGQLTSASTSARAIAFGTTGTITLTASSASLVSWTSNTNFTYTGTPSITVSGSPTTGTRSFTYPTTGVTNSNVLPFPAISSGSDTLLIQGSGSNLNLFGFGGTVSNNNRTLYGDVTYYPGVTFTAGASVTTLAGGTTTTTQTVTCNGASITFPHTINAPSNTVQLADTLNATGTTNTTLTLVAGTFNANNKTVKCSSFVASGALTRVITMGSSTWNLLGTTGTVWDCSSSTNLTVTSGSVTTVGTATGAQTFNGGGFTYNTLTIAGGTADFTITGTNTFTEINTTRSGAYSILFQAGATNTISTLYSNINGSLGNIVQLKSTISGTVTTLNIGNTRSLNYAVISDVVKTGSGVVTVNNSYLTPNSTGWIYGTNSKNFVIYTSGSGTFTAPNNWNPTSNEVYLIGGGGAGRNGASSAGGGGGGGGAFTKLVNYGIAPTNSVSYSVGVGGATGSASGTSTVFGAYSANGGTGSSSSIGGIGGAAASITGAISLAYSGGTGGNGMSTGTTPWPAGGGGGAAGPLGAGGNGGTAITNAIAGGGGGGGNGGGSAGTVQAGGNNAGGTGGGAAATSGTNGGGGGSASTLAGVAGSGSTGTDILGLTGSGGGSGSNNSSATRPTAGIGAGGGGSAFATALGSGLPGFGADGVIAIFWDPNNNPGNYFLCF